MKKYLLLLIAFMPNIIYAQGSGINIKTSDKKTLGEILKACNSGNCGFNNLLDAANAIGKMAMIFTTAAATVMFVYAGFLYITSQGDSGKVKQATSIFRNVAIGFVIILVAYLLIKELLLKLGLQYLANLIS